MRLTFDIPDVIYQELKASAATEETTVQEIILKCLALKLNMTEPLRHGQRAPFPVLSSKNPGSLRLGEEGVYEYIPFP